MWVRCTRMANALRIQGEEAAKNSRFEFRNPLAAGSEEERKG